MRPSELLFWLLATFSTLFFVSAVLPSKWPQHVRFTFRMVVAVAFFFLIGAYWLTTGEKFDETTYRLLLCRVHDFQRCNPKRVPETTPPTEVLPDQGRRDDDAKVAERRRQAESERQRQAEADAERRRLAEAQRQAELERQHQAELERQKQAEVERQRQADFERQRQAELERQRQVELERQRQADRERQLQVETDRQRQLAEAEAERRRQETERLSRRFAATAVGRSEATKRYFASTFTNQASTSEAETKALDQCNRMSENCKIVARFSGFGKCVHVAHGQSVSRYPGRVNVRSGVRSAATDWEALQKCREAFQQCNVFHSRCNAEM